MVRRRARPERQMVRRKLDGDHPALPEDILGWAMVLDDIMVIYAPSDVGDLAPPAQRANSGRIVVKGTEAVLRSLRQFGRSMTSTTSSAFRRVA